MCLNLDEPKGVPPYHLVTITKTLNMFALSSKVNKRCPAPASPQSAHPCSMFFGCTVMFLDLLTWLLLLLFALLPFFFCSCCKCKLFDTSAVLQAYMCMWDALETLLLFCVSSWSMEGISFWFCNGQHLAWNFDFLSTKTSDSFHIFTSLPTFLLISPKNSNTKHQYLSKNLYNVFSKGFLQLMIDAWLISTVPYFLSCRFGSAFHNAKLCWKEL